MTNSNHITVCACSDRAKISIHKGQDLQTIKKINKKTKTKTKTKNCIPIHLEFDLNSFL